MVDAYIDRVEERKDDITTLAWMSVSLDRTKKLPPLQSLLIKQSQPKTINELESDWEMLNKNFPSLGGEKVGK